MGPYSKFAKNKGALKLLQLLITSYDLCDQDLYSNTCKGTRKRKDQSFQTDPRRKLVPRENPLVDTVTLKCMPQKSICQHLKIFEEKKESFFYIIINV